MAHWPWPLASHNSCSPQPHHAVPGKEGSLHTTATYTQKYKWKFFKVTSIGYAWGSRWRNQVVAWQPIFIKTNMFIWNPRVVVYTWKYIVPPYNMFCTPCSRGYLNSYQLHFVVGHKSYPGVLVSNHRTKIMLRLSVVGMTCAREYYPPWSAGPLISDHLVSPAS